MFPIHTYFSIPMRNICKQLRSSCHLSLSAATLAASVNDRLKVATSFFAMSIQRNGGCPQGLSKHLHSCAARGPFTLNVVHLVC